LGVAGRALAYPQRGGEGRREGWSEKNRHRTD